MNEDVASAASVSSEPDLAGTDREENEFEDPTFEGVETRRKCLTYNLTTSPEREICTVGAEYIIRCRICICPYMGNINNFCRPMPPQRYCEQAFPSYNYVPMGRRTNNETATLNMTDIEYPIEIKLPHNHTIYRCEKPGNLTDECFICECEPNRTLIEEHCFKSDSDACTDATPTFIKAGDRPIAFKNYSDLIQI
ncbi:hypothetical protein PYW07_009654 [Mythimna separata]|uniref:Uncharacterized protein n=1 Tax=Mythimna separata TaxID=271217 RepID=A0AAD7YCX3_MYTSE|nr:hypothetical protein PYW07_009654 [Mythimna separata]